MNPYTPYLAAAALLPSSRVDERFQNLASDAALDHRFDMRGPSLRQRIVSGAASLRRFFGTGTSTGEPALPALRDYPYAG